MDKKVDTTFNPNCKRVVVVLRGYVQDYRKQELSGYKLRQKVF